MLIFIYYSVMFILLALTVFELILLVLMIIQ